MWRRLLGRRQAAENAPLIPYSREYAAKQQAFVTDQLDSRAVIDVFASSGPLPLDFGIGLDERVVEYPWLLSRRPSGRVLDAGSTLNHEHVLDRFLPLFSCLHVVTLAPEESVFAERGVSYLYADLRDLPLRSGYYDTVVCISTLEHVGMDTARYGVAADDDVGPRPSLMAAARELRRVLARGGRLLFTVPYGVPEDHGWLRQFDRELLEEVIAEIEPREQEVTVYEYTASGWQVSSLTAATGARYHDATLHKRAAEDDLAVAARAVACVEALL
jgi:SAM-dependent methyltransferase